MLLSNGGLMDQLQAVISSAPSLPQSACPPPALRCSGHLLLSSLITLQRVHSAQVQLCSYHSCWLKRHNIKVQSRANKAEIQMTTLDMVHAIPSVWWKSEDGFDMQNHFFFASYIPPQIILLVLMWLKFWVSCPFFVSLCSLMFKVCKSISLSLDTAVHRLLLQKRNTENLLLGKNNVNFIVLLIFKAFVSCWEQISRALGCLLINMPSLIFSFPSN